MQYRDVLVLRWVMSMQWWAAFRSELVKYKSVAITNSPGTIRKDIKMLAATKQRILKIFFSIFSICCFMSEWKIKVFLFNCSRKIKFDSLNFWEILPLKAGSWWWVVGEWMQEAKLLSCFSERVAKVTLARMLVEWKIIYFQQKLIQRFVRPKLFKT